ncbi:hypothetical protein [Clostridium sp. YIM B02500]|uniref:hypothetical protein n=1 Tax=Clostridium sp. YIM B02500 TaxID=2910681 RepID=UPI001EEE4BC0|nr:hypothetical protein [Clostridium sp. YIM B02500]
MARRKRKIDNQEVKEIINLKLQELNGDKSKLTYNSVYKFNQNISNNEQYKRNNGEAFNSYGYDFWAGSYKGQDYYGKEQIDKLKSEINPIIAGESFELEIQDIIVLVDKYRNNSGLLTKKLIHCFESDRKKISILKNENTKLKNKLKKAQLDLKLFEQGFASMFYNSSLVDNSLIDVISLTKSSDRYVYDELKNMFNNEEDRLQKIFDNESNDKIINRSVINIDDKKKELIDNEIKKIEDMGF